MLPDEEERRPLDQGGAHDTTQTPPDLKSHPSLDEVYAKLADRPAVPLFRSRRRTPPRKQVKVTPARSGRHTHIFDAAGFCTVCQEHRGYLEAGPAEPTTPAEVLGEPTHGPEPSDDEWLASLLDIGPADDA
jgi:hypothetical protein